jgi:hypothetical protein
MSNKLIMPCPKTFVGAQGIAPSSHFHAYSCAKIFIMGYKIC